MRNETLRGVAAMLAAVGFFAGMDAFLKLFASHYPAVQVSAMRGAASLPFLLLTFAVMGKFRELKPVRWGPAPGAWRAGHRDADRVRLFTARSADGDAYS
ncbi:MAG: hypothetical protein HC872_09615, partial [Gammaproteobacteria bacterium]|nr:hypothetical protein [Gammaproteobacteria bacterium]